LFFKHHFSGGNHVKFQGSGRTSEAPNFNDSLIAFLTQINGLNLGIAAPWKAVRLFLPSKVCRGWAFSLLKKVSSSFRNNLSYATCWVALEKTNMTPDLVLILE